MVAEIGEAAFLALNIGKFGFVCDDAFEAFCVVGHDLDRSSIEESVRGERSGGRASKQVGIHVSAENLLIHYHQVFCVR